ncbi:MAG: serine protease [Cyanobacteria bacterium SZAS-4]|nr:serine protease [Cyanobacteria bacterium SZAS-4]
MKFHKKKIAITLFVQAALLLGVGVQLSGEPANAALTGSIVTSTGADLPAEAVAQHALASTVKLSLSDPDGRNAVSGSGFFIAPDMVATNYHVIKGMGAGYVKFSGDAKQYRIVKVVASDPVNDLVILYVPGTNAKPMDLDPLQQKIGETIFVAGSPLGLEGVFSQGVLSAVRSNGDLQITASISHGNSGGPVLDGQGNVIGIVEYTIPSGQNLNFAIPVKQLLNLMKIANA